MNKIKRVFIAIIGATDIVFNMFLPIAFSLLLVNVVSFEKNWHVFGLIVIGIISSLYRAIDVAFLRGK